MAMDEIERHVVTLTKALNTATGTTTYISMGGFAHGSVIVPTGLSMVTLTFYAAELPNGLFGVRHMKITADVAGTVYIILKG